MYKLIYICLIALSGCIGGNLTVAAPLANADTLTQTQKKLTLSNEELKSVVTLQIEQVSKYQNLELRLIGVQDSRCATDVSCIWAGQLIVTFEVSDEHGEKIKVKLTRKRESEIVNAFSYNFLLLDVAPHPKKGKVIQLSDQIVKLKIVR